MCENSNRFKLGKGLHLKDDLLGRISFEDLVIALQSNESVIDRKSVNRVISEMLSTHLIDLGELLEQNMQEIIDHANG